MSTRDAQALESVSKGQRKLDLAQRLTGALSSENDRWAENVIQLRADMELLTGDVLLAASFIRYATKRTKRLRAFFISDSYHPAAHLSCLCPCLVFLLQLCRALHQGIPRPAHGTGIFALLAKGIPGT